METKHGINKVTAGTLLITLGIIYGDIGTSPLYVMKAIFGDAPINNNLVLGAVSCVLWTLTIQTSIKYVWLTLKADNNGEGGIFSLYTLVKKLKKKWLIIPAIIGGSAMLADGIITPPISISSAIEGIKIYYPELQTIPIVIGIILMLFFFQSYGTKAIGKLFGPIMFLWFLMLAVTGVLQIMNLPEILKAVNPYYAYLLLTEHPEGFFVLGFVFLCTTGAEALYSDLGHCGIKNIRFSWLFVKITLALNYFGQGAFLLSHQDMHLKTFENGKEFIQNPFFLMMPDWFIPIGIVIATMAAVIAAQALITGSFTMINEAMRLNLWPRVLVKYPSVIKGQLYIPSTNWLMCLGCILVVLYFKESSNMEAAYGLAIVMCMISTTILLTYFMILKRLNKFLIIGFVLIYSFIEVSFFIANVQKFHHGGYISLLVAGLLAAVMVIWSLGKRIRKNYTEFIKLKDYVSVIEDLSNDDSIPQYANNLIYLTNAQNKNEIESKVIYSILYKRPKRADIYWMLHVNVLDTPYGMEYQVKKFSDKVIRVDFYLGFRIAPKISPLFKKVLADLSTCGEFNKLSTYHSLRKNQIMADYKYVIIEKVVSYDNELPWFEKFILDCYAFIRKHSLSEEKAFGLDNSSVKIEYYPLILDKNVHDFELKRREDIHE
ncbi:KUP/HAK/KT family potassium transporter [Flavobacterium sp. xlx-214]|uniref:KUP/HAK/KT family potassium transporter n=1 Tax=unclassified Flavobacterium TaxID=196869 RepID=UPI0013D21A8C|nr:KUP/HAK/KT family potassium transporter [Flavobacterium sp. xlx-214]MBA5792072.1 KUP/HAK/KT family potassium transporter [Flavobacterium sp. xlx-221]QMI84319.1 KUP/HAK/KT family potassium transporter [Flavobacterium sp. xlx-214]